MFAGHKNKLHKRVNIFPAGYKTAKRRIPSSGYNKLESRRVVMEVTEEANILNDLIEVNIDACSFYREAADKIAIPQAERAFHDLGRIHTSIVDGLGVAAYRNCGTRSEERRVG